MRPLHNAPYPVIDTDPIFSRVIRYFRWTDVGVAAALTALGPGFMYWMERYQPTGNGGKPLIRSMKFAGGLGATVGFMTAYQLVSARFWGLTENSREIKMYRLEYAKLKAQGKPMHGVSTLPLAMQRTSAAYSTGAFLNFDVFPWFNFVNHPYHGQSEGVIPENEK
ncbi:hypothetical protein GGI02_002371 [Coemansia sp. RSA 2322]|uniref:NADH-ubiquinone oxidoreductase 21 kDa subunit n=1 Tax=Coemansia thaxteri TaxID=2663907 RepID=A0A9W8EH38_9FUNG|nr:hypothetical protein H4R26_004032 [Coemansia thaxteri]KAJ2471290.1 hypothetical protein GGI02_002371 [Coemansia sp. RSA 2322]KAJ2481709.1 hypothetical protein EV174_003402 [Coemansia sp. RSA 2320]